MRDDGILTLDILQQPLLHHAEAIKYNYRQITTIVIYESDKRNKEKVDNW
jgi:hypothetical protein